MLWGPGLQPAPPPLNLPLHGINTFDAILRRSTFSFVHRCSSTVDKFIQAVMSSGCYYDSVFYQLR